jgi:non-canonical poly(A) RNA polymerase PAPD5/7
MTTVKGPWEPSKAEASIKKNVGLQEKARKAAFAESDKLLAIARAAFDDAKEYDGVIVRPMINARPIKESELPWCLKTTERTVSGIERYSLQPSLSRTAH